MAEFIWYGQTTEPGLTTISGANHMLSFYGASFGTPVPVNDYQTTTHNESGGNDHCVTNHINNCKYVSSNTININEAGNQTLTSGTYPTEATCTLKVNFSDASSVALSNVSFWADDGATSTAVPTDIDFRMGEYGDAAWSSPEGSGASKSLESRAASTSHDYFLFVSASPETVGTLTAFRLQIELTYQ